VRTPIGVLPAPGELDLDGLDLPERDLDLLLSVDPEVWSQEAALMPEYFAQFGDRLPAAITREHAALVERLEHARRAS
jgi:phosphoenolpyruvate carboxykinase (GTP)